MLTTLFFPLLTQGTCQKEMEHVIEFLSFFLSVFLSVQNVTHGAFFLPNVLNLGNFSPVIGSRRFSWQFVVP